MDITLQDTKRPSFYAFVYFLAFKKPGKGNFKVKVVFVEHRKPKRYEGQEADGYNKPIETVFYTLRDFAAWFMSSDYKVTATF